MDFKIVAEECDQSAMTRSFRYQVRVRFDSPELGETNYLVELSEEHVNNLLPMDMPVNPRSGLVVCRNYFKKNFRVALNKLDAMQKAHEDPPHEPLVQHLPSYPIDAR